MIKSSLLARDHAAVHMAKLTAKSAPKPVLQGQNLRVSDFGTGLCAQVSIDALRLLLSSFECFRMKGSSHQLGQLGFLSGRCDMTVCHL